MSPAGSSVESTSSSIVGFVKKIAQNSRPGVEVIIDDHTPQKIYTTFDAVTGVVKITAPQNTRFDEINITLEGRSKTFIENFSAAGTRSRSVASHCFLKLVMPMSESSYPQPRIAEAGFTYSFPFNFNIPEQLLPRSCGHKVQSAHVEQAHLQLPSSLGDKAVAGRDDLAPDMSKITYAVKAEVVRNGDASGSETVLVEGLKKLRVVPAVAEAPPLSFVDDDGEYNFSKAKTLKKGLFSGTLGRITITAAQTKALVLPPPKSPTCTSVISMATLNLRFYPNGHSAVPPRLGGVTAKIKTSTFFSVMPSQVLPNFSTQRNAFEGARSVYSTTLPLASRCVESVTWTKHEPHSAELRRESNSSTSSDGSFSIVAPEDDDVLHYSAKIVVPIALPSSKSWVPSFNSCLISRVYALEFSLTVHTPGTGVPASSLSLRLPVQIASAGNPGGRSRLTAAEAAEELASANDFFVPRVMEVPDPRLVGNSFSQSTPSAGPIRAPEHPPNYNDFGPARIVTPGKC